MPIWLSERPTIHPKGKWTLEEDEKLLELRKKFIKWEKISNELSHTPFQCIKRWSELRQQMLKAKRQQQNEPKLMFPPSENWDSQPSRSASQLVSKAHKEAVNSLSGSGSTQLGIVAADNSALRATREIDGATISSVRNILGSVFNISVDDQVDDPAIIKLRECEEKVKKLCEEKVRELSDEIDQLVKQKDLAINEAHLRRAELDKVREHVAFLEAGVVRAEEKQRNAEIEVDAKVMEQRKAASLLEKQFLMGYIYALEAEFQRTNKQQLIETKEDFLRRHFSHVSNAHLLTKYVESSLKNLDKQSKRLKISSNFGEGNYLHFSGGSQGSIHLTDGAQLNDNQATVKIQEEVNAPSTQPLID